MMDTDGGYTDWTYEQVKGRLEEEDYEKACKKAGENIKEASTKQKNPWYHIAKEEREHPVTGKETPMSESALNNLIKNIRR